MEYVVPIKDVEKINTIKNILKKSSLRDYLLFVLGINTGLTIYDLLNLKVEDVWDGKKGKEFICLDGDHPSFYLNNRVQMALEEYMLHSGLKPTDYLFQSKKNKGPITRQQAYRIINRAVKEAGIKEKIGLHTLRKTFGYHAYQKGIAISIIMSILNQHSKSQTLKYIDITEEEKKHIKVDVNL
jgi:site-specific recombinase XerD